MARLIAISFICLIASGVAQAQQIGVNPTGVNVNAHGATTVFLTYGPIKNYVAAEACWSGELVSAAPHIGLKSDPAALFGCLPARYEHTTPSAQSAYTDIMSIPPSVARRAYQAAVSGADSRFFYVRRFVSTAGGPDQFVAVTCRLTGGGARTPFSLTDFKLSFEVDTPVLMIRSGEQPPKIKAAITYTGTGRLKGRWEVVRPGDELPSDLDLLTEATLPLEQRPTQRRYTQLTRFNVFLPPVGSYTLVGPDPSLLPTAVEGPYLILLRVEASDDKEADSDLTIVGNLPEVVHSGAVAGFSLPPLRYFVGSGAAAATGSTISLNAPGDNEPLSFDKPVDFLWSDTASAAVYMLELVNDRETVLSALLPPGVTTYKAPSWLEEKRGAGDLRWRVIALDGGGNEIGKSKWRTILAVPRR